MKDPYIFPLHFNSFPYPIHSFQIEMSLDNSTGFPHTPCGRFKKYLTHGKCEYQVSSFGTSKWNTYSLCDKPNLQITQKIRAFKNAYSPCGTLFQNLSQGVWILNGVDQYPGIVSIGQGFPTCGPRAACGPGGNFVRPAMSNASIYLLNFLNNETRTYYITIFWLS